MAFWKLHNIRAFTGDVAASSLSSRLILLVNERADADIEQIIGVCLEHLAGWQIVSVSQTAQELVLPLQQKPDAIPFNAQLSRQYGLSFVQKRIVQQIRRYPLTQATPILLLIDTAHWMTLQQMESLGIVGAIAKPFNPVTLPEKISELLGWDKP